MWNSTADMSFFEAQLQLEMMEMDSTSAVQAKVWTAQSQLVCAPCLPGWLMQLFWNQSTSGAYSMEIGMECKYIAQGLPARGLCNHLQSTLLCQAWSPSHMCIKCQLQISGIVWNNPQSPPSAKPLFQLFTSTYLAPNLLFQFSGRWSFGLLAVCFSAKNAKMAEYHFYGD